ncbi:MAG: type IV secretory system conjugative DNA transfer family protein [Novosphingobium sp.]|nr:type IV secretory system conjugative DNA transfer family protein [Novosphingobium sp.]
MAEIDFGIPLKSKSGAPELDAIIADGEPMLKSDRSPYRVKFGGPEHILTIGPTRSGKGRRLLTPELIYDTDRAIIVVDPKGELAKWTAAHRARFGEVFAVDPFGVLADGSASTLTSTGYNPMRWLDPTSDDFIDDATVIAEAICPVESQREPHFEQGAQEIVSGLILYHRLINADAKLGDIRRDLGRTPKEWRDLLLGDDNGQTKEGWPCVFLVADEHEIPALWTKLGELSAISAEDRELNGFIRAAKTQTRFLDSPPVSRDLARPGVDFGTIKSKPATVYLVLPPVRLVTHAKWLRLVIAGAIEALRKAPGDSKQPEVLIILDEFPQLGRMQGVETGVQLNAGYGIKFWIVVQNLSQLQTLYHDNWETFTSAGALTAYGPRDPTTAEYLAKLSGERTIEVRSDSYDHEGRSSVSVSRQRRENVMPHQFEQLGKGRMFVRLPSDRYGVARYITEVADFTTRDDIPEAVRRLGK